MPGAEERAALQASLCRLIRDVPAHHWAYRTERALAAAREGKCEFSPSDEIMWAAIAAVANSPELLDAVHQCAQVVRLDADLADSLCIPLLRKGDER